MANPCDILTSCPSGGKMMGFQLGLEDPSKCFKRKFRWMFSISDGTLPLSVVPTLKGARPSMQFKEQEVQHLSETIFYPMKPEWKTIEFTFYDLDPNKIMAMDWMKGVYDPKTGLMRPVINSGSPQPFKRKGCLQLYSGCGTILEEWILDNCYPQAIDFGDLDMESSEITSVSVTIRYDRAYLN